MKTIKLNAIDSTNTYLKGLSKKEVLVDGIIVVAEKQVRGRGQMGTIWQSKVGQSLTFSIFKRFSHLTIQYQSYINFAVSLGIKEALTLLKVPNVSIKWPNDIMADNKKLCGVLIENQIEASGKVSSSVIGVGLNVNETSFKNLPQAGSMYLSSGNLFDLNEVLQKISEEIFLKLKQIDSGNVSLLKSKYEEFLFQKNKVSTFETPSGKKFNGVIMGVTESGELLLDTDENVLEKYQMKEIKLLF